MREFICGAWLLLSLFAAAAVTRAASPDEAGAPLLRVLLEESSGPVWLGGARVEVAGAGLEVDGVPVGEAWWPEGPDSQHLGSLEFWGRVGVRRSEHGLWVLNHVPLEHYVLGTLAGEVFEGWHPEMLKAQAVAIRSFALHRRQRRRLQAYDVSAGTQDQVYLGVAAQSEKLEEAVRATQGEILVHAGLPILAAFHSASGGRTASAEEVWGSALPYLVSVEVRDEEESPDTYWRARFPGPTLGRALGAVGIDTGRIREVRVTERSQSGRVVALWVSGDEGSGTVSGRALRSQLGDSVLRSTLFEVHRAGNDILFVGSGHGHGVGMSQWGGQAMADRGASYREILDVFYPGTELTVRGMR